MAQASARIVICGAGIAGAAAAYYLTAADCGEVTLVEPGNPLSLTSDKSTEAYRNWWPGPDQAMTAFMNRSIDLLEGIAGATANRINLNRRGYLFATADPAKIPFLEAMALRAEALGAGPARRHADAASPYVPSPERGFDLPLAGADVITDRALLRRHFPFLAPEAVAAVHARRAGWLSAQQLGMTFLEGARERGAKLLRGRVVAIDAGGGRVRGITVEQAGERHALAATHVVLAAGPMQVELARLLGVELPIFAERHFKTSLPDPSGALAGAPLLIWLDAQRLPWSAEEREALAGDAEARWLLEEFPAGVHGRPEGSGATAAAVILFNNYREGPAEILFPLPEAPHYAEIALRAMATMVPALKAYLGKGARPYVDGGYYVKTRENRPLIGPLPVAGAYVSCGFSGFGVMASCAAGELVARHVREAPLPDYAPAFLLSRYEDPEYRAMLVRWGDGGQL